MSARSMANVFSQLTWPIGGGHCGHSPSCLEDPVIITFPLRPSWRSVWAIVSVFFGLVAFIPFPNGLNVTRLSSTFAVVERLVDVMAHLDNEDLWIRG